MKNKHQFEQLSRALQLLNGRLKLMNSPKYSIVICGGSALLALSLVSRTTKDIDIVALIDDDGTLVDPAPLPENLLKAATLVASDMNIFSDWLNNGPSSGDGGIFRLGLPDGFKNRLVKNEIGSHLTVYYIGRKDQIFFKLYAAIDQYGSYHADDLAQLSPTDSELIEALHWSMSHDPSEGYRVSAENFLKGFGYEHIIGKF